MNPPDNGLLPVLLFLADSAVRATVLLVLAAVVAVLARRGGASASLRHLVWTLGLACALLLPLLSRTLPGWHIALLPPMPSVVRSEPSRETKRGSELSAPSVAVARLPAAASVPPADPVARRDQDAAPRVPNAYFCLLVVWTTGVLFALVKLAQGWMSLGRLERRHSAPVSDPLVLRTAADAQAAMRVTRPVALRQAHAAMRAVRVPMTYGALRPVIVLPAGIEDWPAQRLRAALLHELAHVRRWDWPLQMLAQVVRALYWFHPLTWLALDRVRAESEDACDDLVLASGMPAREYARHLVDVALGARDREHDHRALTAGMRTGAVAMAQTPKVETRVRTILTPGKNRADVTSALRAAVLVSTTAVVCVGAVIRPTDSRAAATPPARPPRTAVTWAALVQAGGPRGPLVRTAQPQRFTAVTLSLEALTKQLSLTPAQQARITQALSGLTNQRHAMRGRMEEEGQRRKEQRQAGGHASPDTDPATARQKAQEVSRRWQELQKAGMSLRTAEQSADRAIRAALTPEQRATLNALLIEAEMLRDLGVPPEVLSRFVLAADEKAALKSLYDDSRRERQRLRQRARNSQRGGLNLEAMRARIGEEAKQREETYQKALAATTPEHKAAIEEYVKANPQWRAQLSGVPGWTGPGEPVVFGLD